MRRFIIALLLTVFMISVTSAWKLDTHRKISSEICSDLGCSCRSDIKEGSVIPDTIFNDSKIHYCYERKFHCIGGDWICPDRMDCPTTEKTNYWLNLAKSQTGCEMWKSIGIASNYFMDGQEFFNRVTKESLACRESFENDTNEHFINNDLNWSVCYCGVCVSDTDFGNYKKKFESKLDFVQKKNRVILVANSIDLSYAQDFINFLVNKSIDVISISAENFSDYKEENNIILLGGQNAPEGIGNIAGTLLTVKEKESILATNTSKNVFTKNNIYTRNQIIKVLAGYEKEQTQSVWVENKEKIVDEILTRKTEIQKTTTTTIPAQVGICICDCNPNNPCGYCCIVVSE